MRDNELFRKDPPSLLSPEGLHGCASAEGLQKCSKLTVLAGKCIIKIITWIKTITWIKKNIFGVWLWTGDWKKWIKNCKYPNKDILFIYILFRRYILICSYPWLTDLDGFPNVFNFRFMTRIHYKSTAKNLKRGFYFCASAIKYGTKIENVK